MTLHYHRGSDEGGDPFLGKCETVQSAVMGGFSQGQNRRGLRGHSSWSSLCVYQCRCRCYSNVMREMHPVSLFKVRNLGRVHSTSVGQQSLVQNHWSSACLFGLLKGSWSSQTHKPEKIYMEDTKIWGFPFKDLLEW